MTGMLINSGTVELKDVPFDVFSVGRILFAENIELITMSDAVMYLTESAKDIGLQRNDLASLIARTEVYGPALIAGFGGTDVPQIYVDAYMA